MGTYFLDTSALVKRYVDETGSRWVMTLCRPRSGHTIIISQATLVESVAAFCRKTWEQNPSQRVSETDRDRNIRRFRQHVRRQYGIVQVTSTLYTQAGNLCRSHRLRAYDAIQLACALEIRTKLAALGIGPTFVSADMNLLSIAQTEGLSVENPNTYP